MTTDTFSDLLFMLGIGTTVALAVSVLVIVIAYVLKRTIEIRREDGNDWDGGR